MGKTCVNKTVVVWRWERQLWREPEENRESLGENLNFRSLADEADWCPAFASALPALCLYLLLRNATVSLHLCRRGCLDRVS